MAIDWEQYAVKESAPPESNAAIDWEQYAAPEKNQKHINMPTGINMATGFLSQLGGDSAQSDIIRNLPQILAGTQPSTQENIEKNIGEYAPIAPDVVKGVIGAGKLGANAIKGGFNTVKDMLTPAASYKAAVKQSTEAAQTAEEAAQAAKKIPPGKIAYEGAKSPIEAAENQIGRELKIEAPHAMRVSEQLKHRIGSIENYWSQRYKTLMENLKSTEFKMPKESLEKLDTDKILKQVKQGGLEDVRSGKIGIEEKSPFLKDLLGRAPTSKDVSAADFVSKYKDFRNGLYNLRQIAKSTLDEALRRQLFKDIGEASEVEKKIQNTLHEGLGKHAADFKEINQGYSEHIFPLRSNAVAKKIMKGGPMSDNIIKELGNNKEGAQILKDIAKQDPEIVKHILGQQYLKNPGLLHNPNEAMREFLDEVPHVKDMLKNKESILEDIAKNKNSTLEQKVKAEAKLDRIKRAKGLGGKVFGKSLKAAAIVGSVGYAGSLINSLLRSSNQGEE